MINRKLVDEILGEKGEGLWMRSVRLKGLKAFDRLSIPEWGADLSRLSFNNLKYYIRSGGKEAKSWNDVPLEIRKTFERIGVPEAEREYLAGVKGQFNSEVVYGSLKSEWEKKGVIFASMDEAVRKYPDLVAKYWGKVIPVGDNKFCALNNALWSGGSFVYVPSGVELSRPIQAYFRIGEKRMGQFERTLIVAEEGSRVHYIEGCSAPAFSGASLHAGVVEVVVKKGARVQYTTIQNWYRNVYNLVTKRAVVEDEGEMIWVDGNLGSRVTMKYPSCVLKGRKARGEMISLAVAGKEQHLDTGAKMIHIGEETSSQITSKSISKDGGRSSYRGMVKMCRGAKGARSRVVCDALIMDDRSRSDTYPVNIIEEGGAIIEHEASVSRVGDDQLFYLRSRGIGKTEAESMIVNGFVEPVVRQIPFEFAIEINRLIDMEMEGSVG